jgi:peptidoglycan/LPS O-acetylase OafA/YrhL
MFCVTAAMLLDRSPNVTSPERQWRWFEYLSNLCLTTNLTYTDNMVGGLWTLPLEVQMYVARRRELKTRDTGKKARSI